MSAPPPPASASEARAQAKHWGTPPDALEGLASSHDDTTRQYVAGNPGCPARVLARLAGDKIFVVRAVTASNAFTPPDVLAQLAASSFGGIRVAVAQNHATPPEVLTDMAGSVAFNGTMMQGLAKNPNTPPEVMSRLAKHANRGVRLAARSAIEVRLSNKFEIDSDNEGALEFLCDQAWWDLTPESPEVALAIALSPNQ